MRKKLRVQILEILAGFNRKYRFPFSRRIFNFISPADKWIEDSRFRNNTIKYDTKLKINIDPSSYIEWQIFFYGYYEKDVVDLFKRIIKKDWYVFDIGANIGCHTLIASSLVGNKGKIISIEPHPKVFKRLIQNLEINNLNNVQVFNLALSNTCGNSILYSSGNCNQGTSSLVDIDSKRDKIIVKCMTLDEMMKSEKLFKIDFLKIDVEGFELNILIGAKESIRKYQPYILFEYNERFWSKLGYDLNKSKIFFDNLEYTYYALDGKYLRTINKYRVGEFNIFAFPISKKDEIFKTFFLKLE